MNEDAVATAITRIDRALARIEAAARSRAADHARLQRRHAVLRDRVGEAIAALDQHIAEGQTDG